MQRWTRANYQPVRPIGKNGRVMTASKEHREISRRAARQGMVLLKNDGGLLPLKEGTKAALFGKGTIDYVKGGGGSGDTTVPEILTIADGFERLSDRVTLFNETVDFYRDYVEKEYENGGKPGMICEPELPEELLSRAASFADVAIISISRYSGEGWDRKSEFDRSSEHNAEHEEFRETMNRLFKRGDFYLSGGEKKLVEDVCRYFGKVAVVLNIGGAMDTSWFRDNPSIQSVLLAWQGGMEGGLAEAELLCGLDCPGGHLSDTLAAHLEDYPSSDTFYVSDDYVSYYEDIYVGYRYFETIRGKDKCVVYPFGYGLSYTTFEISEATGYSDGDQIKFRCNVKNTGMTAGREVVQLYLSAPQGKLGKPARELAAFGKTKELKPGESEVLLMSFMLSDFASYDDTGKVQRSAYVLEKGTYTFYYGSNVRDCERLSFTAELEEDVTVKQLSEKLAPRSLEKRLLSDGSFEELTTKEEIRETGIEKIPPFDLSLAEYPAPQEYFRDSLKQKNDLTEEEEAYSLQKAAAGKQELSELIENMSDDDLCRICGGQAKTGVGVTFGIGNNKAFEIPNLQTTDGPAGVRVKKETGCYTTAMPVATLLSCTWDTDLLEEVGRTIAEEAMENNLSIWLAPAINIHRTPLCGRNFEYFSEDPRLTALLASAEVKGCQGVGIAATIKHFAANNKETNRKNSDSRVSERALREIYLRAFEQVIRDSDPWAVMCSYNIINGVRVSENRELLTDILRDEWDYKGLLMTDWWTYGDPYKELNAGIDVKMPAGFPERITEALKTGLVDRKELKRAAENVCKIALKIE